MNETNRKQNHQGGFTEIPIVDLSRWNGTLDEQLELAEEVRSICHHIGFLCVTNHGIKADLVASLFELMERFFALPEEQKALIDKSNSRHLRGWERVGAERTNNRPDIREQIDLWSETVARDIDVEPNYFRLLGPNQWMPDDVLPGFRSLAMEWFEQAGKLAETLLEILSVGLGLERDHINSLFGDECMSLTKLIRYPATPAGAAGVNAHHDTGFLTVLAPGPTAGLEVQNSDGDWIPVPTIPDAFVINLGEMLQGMTGNYFVATAHRVITRDERLSMGYFHGPSLDTQNNLLPLAPEFMEAVANSPRHANAGFMARKFETDAGVNDMASNYKASVYGEQLWNYFQRSYPEIMQRFYPAG